MFRSSATQFGSQLRQFNVSFDPLASDKIIARCEKRIKINPQDELARETLISIHVLTGDGVCERSKGSHQLLEEALRHWTLALAHVGHSSKRSIVDITARTKMRVAIACQLLGRTSEARELYSEGHVGFAEAIMINPRGDAWIHEEQAFALFQSFAKTSGPFWPGYELIHHSEILQLLNTSSYSKEDVLRTKISSFDARSLASYRSEMLGFHLRIRLLCEKGVELLKNDHQSRAIDMFNRAIYLQEQIEVRAYRSLTEKITKFLQVMGVPDKGLSFAWIHMSDDCYELISANKEMVDAAMAERAKKAATSLGIQSLEEYPARD